MLRTRQLSQWDWRWRLPFDEALDDEVSLAAHHLRDIGDRQHASILIALRAHAHQAASLGGLLSSLGEEPDAEKRSELIAAAQDCALNGVPAGVSRALERQITRVAENSSERTNLLRLLRSAEPRPWNEPHSAALELVFGESLGAVVAFGQRLRRTAGPPLPLGDRLDARDAPRLVEDFVRDHADLSDLLAEFSTDVVAGRGFAAYWPREFDGSVGDRLEIEANADSLRSVPLRQTLAHELAGHGVFYEALRRASPAFIDHGGLALVEGWATFAEWHLSSPGPDGVRLGLLDLLGAGEDEVLERIPQLVRAQGYSAQQVDDALVSWTQLPAFQASYLLGGLWFSERAATFAEGLELLAEILAQPVGDFLSLY